MIVLDTHVWLWWVNLDRTWLKASWVRQIESSKLVGVSSISCFEVAWLERHKRIWNHSFSNQGGRALLTLLEPLTVECCLLVKLN